MGMLLSIPLFVAGVAFVVACDAPSDAREQSLHEQSVVRSKMKSGG